LFRKTVSVIMLFLLVISTLTFAFKIQSVKADGATIYINADGSISPSSAPISTVDNVTYVFTGNVSLPTSYGLVVERSNIVVNGNGYAVQGNNSGEPDNSIGLNLTDTSNVTIENIEVQAFQLGIFLVNSSGNTISGNTATANVEGIWLTSSSNNNVSGNNATANGDGIYLINSANNNNVSGNNVSKNRIFGVALQACSNNVVIGNNATANGQDGICLGYSSNDNVVAGNSAAANGGDGIQVFASSSNDTVCGNILTSNYNGVDIGESSNNTVSENIATANSFSGIRFGNSDNNTASGNILTSNYNGIYLISSSYNNFERNTAAQNSFAIVLSYSSGNTIYHNSFTNNAGQVSSNSVNVWDNGYPSGGNYWSDYRGGDLYSGPYQNVSGSDGIGDTPYTIDANNIDHYPIMNPWGSGHDVAVTDVLPSKTVVGQAYGLNVTVKTTDFGSYTETFNITVCTNTTVIAFQNVTLQTGNSTTISFMWNTTGFAYGNYTISAYALPVPGETNTANNNCTGGLVEVSIIGDVNGDFKVDMKDIALVARAFGSTPSSSNWNPNADVNCDGTINMRDIALVARHFGQHYP
jgi:parallel beta-helix repeat protein